MDELPDDVMAEIREHVQAGRRGWDDLLRVQEEERLLEAVFGEK
jgi:beta-lactamase class A